MRPGQLDDAVAGAAQGRIYANYYLRSGPRRAKAALKNGLRDALGTAQARLELLVLPGRDGHGGRCRGIQFLLFRPELKTKSSPLANPFHFILHFKVVNFNRPWKNAS
jgi:hypothetical protein